MRTRMSELAVLVVYVLTLPASGALLATSSFSPTESNLLYPSLQPKRQHLYQPTHPRPCPAVRQRQLLTLYSEII